MDSVTSPPGGLFDEALVPQVEVTGGEAIDANGGVNKRFKPFDPDAVMLVAPSLDEWLPQDHLARFIAELIDDELDLTRFYASYAKAKGQPPYDPRLMLRIVLYGYCTGVRSSRKLERACVDVVAFRWLAAQQAPDFRSIARFRDRHLAALANVFLQALELCRAAGMVKLGHVALDGTKLRANASRHKAMSYARLTGKQKVLADEISDLLAEAKTVDKDEDALFGLGKRGDELPKELANRQARAKSMAIARASIEEEATQRARGEAEDKARTKAAKDHAKAAKDRTKTKTTDHGDDVDDGDGDGGEEALVRAAGDAAAAVAVPKPAAQRNFTDPDARMMKTSDGSFHYCFNAQAVVDSEYQVIVAADLSQATNDYGQLVPMTDQVLQNLGEMPKIVSADAGYCSNANLGYADGQHTEHGTDFYVSTARIRRTAATTTTPTTKKPSKKAPAEETLTQKMAAKLKTDDGKAIYARRKAIVEPVFGQIHTRQGKYLLLRGMEKVTKEWQLLTGTHNLLKLHTFRTQTAG